MHVLVPRVPSMEIGLFESFGFVELQDTFCVAWDSNGLVMSCVRLLSEGLCTAIASAVDKKLMTSREFRARMAPEILNILKASLGMLGRWVDGSIDCERKCSRLISDEEFKSSWLGSHPTGSAKPALWMHECWKSEQRSQSCSVKNIPTSLLSSEVRLQYAAMSCMPRNKRETVQSLWVVKL